MKYVKAPSGTIKHVIRNWGGAYGLTMCGKVIKPTWNFVDKSIVPKCRKCQQLV